MTVSRLDDPGFEQFVKAQLPRLLAVARVLTGNDHDAWDLVQDSLARVGSRWSHINNRDDPFAYARKTLVNQNLNRARRGRRETLLSNPPDQQAPVDAARGFEHAWLESALRKLSRQQRAAVVLAYMEDQSVAQIAEALGCSTSAAKTHLARGRRALRAAAPTTEPEGVQP
ncbi:MAG: SigE family RNA polymerase sigma factor [Actinomycetota bacterium]|nr:SigE family RNA polymerase sigma factor [Actinomycetota bacterium]